MCSLSTYFPRVSEVFIFKFIKSEVSQTSHMLESNFKHQFSYCFTKLSWNLNHGPKPRSNQSFSICQWNLNSISGQSYIKILLIRAYISAYKFDVICISENYFDPDTSDDDNNLKIPGYNLIWANNPSSV